MDGKSTPMEIQIQEAIDSGTLTPDKLEGGLIALIQEEMSQNERPANMELVNACEDLLFRIHNHEYISNKTESLAKAKAKLAQLSRKTKTSVFPLRVAALVVLIFCGSLIAEALIREERLTDHSTLDEQQLIISGEVVEGPYDSVLADGKSFLVARDTPEWQEAVDTLGYIPNVPTWLPEGWKLQEYYASTSRYVSVFRIQYEHAGYENLIKYSESCYADVEMAITTFEQNNDGEEYQWNGMPVYISSNTDELIAVWIEEKICYSLSGPLTLDEIELVINSIQRS